MSSTPITPEGLVALNFERVHLYSFVLNLKFTEIEYHITTRRVFVGEVASNAKTIEDIKELIRLFK
jgi:hypothetical protein